MQHRKTSSMFGNLRQSFVCLFLLSLFGLVWLGLVNTSTPFLIFIFFFQFSVLENVWKHRTTLEHSEFTMVIRADNLGKSNEKFEC